MAKRPEIIILQRGDATLELANEAQRNVAATIAKLQKAGWRIVTDEPPKAPLPPQAQPPARVTPAPVVRPVPEPPPSPPPAPKKRPSIEWDGEFLDIGLKQPPEVKKPLVSVIMPAWNAAPYIARAIASMKGQTLRDWELLIVDDGSTDKTSAAAKQAARGDKRIKLARQPHGGYAIATNTALCMSSGDIIARLDADDGQHPDRLRRAVTYLLEHPDCDIVTCDMTDIDVEDKQLRVHHTGPMVPQEYVKGAGGPCHASAVAWRRVYDTLGGFDPAEEWDGDGGWNLRAIMLNMVWGHIAEPDYYHRRYPEMRSERFRAEQDGMHKDLLAAYAGRTE